MALAKIPGNVVDVQVATNLVTPVWKKIVCGTDTSIDGSVDTTTVTTKCGSIKARGSVSWTASGSAVANSTPGANEISITEIGTYFQDGTTLRMKVAHISNESLFYTDATGTFSAFTIGAGVDDNLNFDWTFEYDGNLDFTA